MKALLKPISLLLCVLLALTALPVSAADWSIDDGVLTVYSDSALESRPWGDAPFHSLVCAEGVTAIPKDAFRDNALLESVVFSDTVVSIGEATFYNCTELVTADFGSGLQYTSLSSFGGCGKLEAVAFPEGFRSIGESCFYKCFALSSVSLPDSLETIGRWAFYYCSSLESIEIPAAALDIRACAFYRCFALKSISFPEGIEEISGAVCYECVSLTDVYMPQSVEYIGDSAFEGCSSLAGIQIPENVDTIEYNTFARCPSLLLVYIPSGITVISDIAFLSSPNVILIGEGEYLDGYSRECGIPVYRGSTHSDISPEAWYYNAVTYCCARGYMAGTSADSFMPRVPCSRTMAVTLLARLCGAETDGFSGSSLFADVKSGSWYDCNVGWAYSAGISAGTGGGDFSPSRRVTRAEFALMLKKAAELTGLDTSGKASLDGFSDARLVPAWAREALEWAVSYKLISGRPAGLLAPGETLSRSECAQIIYKLDYMKTK